MNAKQKAKGVCVCIMAITIILNQNKKNRNKKVKQLRKRVWSSEWLLRRYSGKDLTHMAIKELKLENPKAFQNFSRLSKETFEELLSFVGPQIQKQNTNMRECISPSTRLLITLRFLATGNSYTDLSYGFRVSVAAISFLVTETVKAIYSALSSKYLAGCKTTLDWKRIAEAFYQKWNFPMCLGAIDGKHIAFRAQSKDGSVYYNYKGFNSVILMAVVDANYKFIMVDVGTNGRANDAAAFNFSEIGNCIKNNLLNFPENEELPGTTTKVPYVFVSDDAFRLSSRILKPYGQRTLFQNKIFNYRLSRARRIVENAFGILANRFQVLQHEINLSVEKVENIVLTCCALHNFLATEDISYSETANLTNIQMSESHKGSNEGSKVRDDFRDFFNNTDVLPWQYEAVTKFNF